MISHYGRSQGKGGEIAVVSTFSSLRASYQSTALDHLGVLRRTGPPPGVPRVMQGARRPSQIPMG